MEVRHSFHILAHQGMASPEESSCGGACAASLAWLPRISPVLRRSQLRKRQVQMFIKPPKGLSSSV